jgi:hypothetical protein
MFRLVKLVDYMTLHFSSSIYTLRRMRSSHTRDARMMSECIKVIICKNILTV